MWMMPAAMEERRLSARMEGRKRRNILTVTIQQTWLRQRGKTKKGEREREMRFQSLSSVSIFKEESIRREDRRELLFSFFITLSLCPPFFPSFSPSAARPSLHSDCLLALRLNSIPFHYNEEK